ncbi:hypothetical protein J6590_062721 [Homalodisca vitripennis]|nr:hypothetical protein J6590_062721 [Homalodisca vitripennis]
MEEILSFMHQEAGEAVSDSAWRRPSLEMIIVDFLLRNKRRPVRPLPSRSMGGKVDNNLRHGWHLAFRKGSKREPWRAHYWSTARLKRGSGNRTGISTNRAVSAVVNLWEYLGMVDGRFSLALDYNVIFHRSLRTDKKGIIDMYARRF